MTLDIILSFLFLVSDHPTWSHVIISKSSLRSTKVQVNKNCYSHWSNKRHIDKYTLLYCSQKWLHQRKKETNNLVSICLILADNMKVILLCTCNSSVNPALGPFCWFFQYAMTCHEWLLYCKHKGWSLTRELTIQVLSLAICNLVGVRILLWIHDFNHDCVISLTLCHWIPWLPHTPPPLKKKKNWVLWC